jgi:hypothetical protein
MEPNKFNITTEGALNLIDSFRGIKPNELPGKFKGLCDSAVKAEIIRRTDSAAEKVWSFIKPAPNYDAFDLLTKSIQHLTDAYEAEPDKNKHRLNTATKILQFLVTYNKDEGSKKRLEELNEKIISRQSSISQTISSKKDSSYVPIMENAYIDNYINEKFPSNQRPHTDAVAALRNFQMAYGNHRPIKPVMIDTLLEYMKDPERRAKMLSLSTKALAGKQITLQNLYNNKDFFPHGHMEHIKEFTASKTNTEVEVPDLGEARFTPIFMFLSYLMDTTVFQNTQLHCDTFNYIVKPGYTFAENNGTYILTGFDMSEAGKNRYAQASVQAHNETERKLKELYQRQSQLNEENNKDALNEINKEIEEAKDLDCYAFRDHDKQIKERAGWKNLKRSDTQPFISGTRVLNFLNNKGVHFDVEVDLNLEFLGPLNRKENIEVMDGINEIMSLLNQQSDTKEYKRQDLIDNPPPEFLKIREQLPNMPDEKFMKFIETAVNFNYDINRQMCLRIIQAGE